MTADTVKPITDREIAAMVEWAVFYPSLDRPKKSVALEEKAILIQRIHARLAAAEAENARLREALKPFTMVANSIHADSHDAEWEEVLIQVGDYRRARTALNESEAND